MLMSVKRSKKEIDSGDSATAKPTESVIDHLCGNLDLSTKHNNLIPAASVDLYEDSDEPDVSLSNQGYSVVPDLTLRYPPTFSDNVISIFNISSFIMILGSHFWC